MSDTAKIDHAGAAPAAGQGVSQSAASQEAAPRVCGECTACCTVMGIAALNKPGYSRCVHECGRCGIYDSRPEACRKWSCGWLLGRVEGDERRRPDRLGLMFNREPLAGKPITVAYEVWPGAAAEANNDFLLRKMSQQIPIVLREYQTLKCRVITPDREKWEYIDRLVRHCWCLNLYDQVVVSSFS
ncbi:MAG TPA: hypothetical protein VHY91_23485 [Pirellulales bacterium]|nr:hypothetical protein [Pirellulales bacterium]